MDKPEEKTPTPHVQTSEEKREIKKKNFFAEKKAGKYPAKKKHPNFPAGKNRKRKDKIVPAHRVIFQNYKDQGFRSLGKAIRKTGVYSEGVAKRVDQITKSQSWQMLMKEYMPDEYLAKRHSELLDKRSFRTIKNPDGTTEEVDNGPETAAVTKGLELAYRIGGKFGKEEAPQTSTVMYNLFYKPEIREQMRIFEGNIKETLLHEINKKNMADIRTEEENEANMADAGGETDPSGSADGGAKKGDKGTGAESAG